MKRIVVLAAALMLAATSAHAEVKKFMSRCDGKLCPYFHIVMTPPDGWVLDEEATRQNKVQMLVPKGTNFHTAPALIYVQVFYLRNKEQPLDNFAAVSNERWRSQVKEAKITALPAVARANGKAGFLRFAFDNPANQQQAFEYGAFGIDNDTDGNTFVLDVVMTALNKAALDKAEQDYVAFLKAH